MSDKRTLRQIENTDATETTNKYSIRKPTILKRTTVLTEEKNIKKHKPATNTTATQPSTSRNQPPTIRSSSSIPKPNILKPSVPSKLTTSSSSKQTTTAPAIKKVLKPWDLKGRIIELQSSLDEHVKKSQEKISTMESERSDLVESFKKSQERLSEIEEEFNTLNTKYQNIMKEEKDLREKYEDSKNKYDDLSSEYSKTKTENETLKSDVWETNNELSSLKSLLDVKSDLIKRYENEIVELKTSFNEQKEKVKCLQSENSRISEELVKSLEEINKLSNVNVLLNSRVNDLSAKNFVLQEENMELTNKLIKSQQEGEALRSQLSSSITTFGESQTKLNFVTLKLDMTEGEREKLKKDFSESLQVVEGLRNDIQNYQKELGEADIGRRLLHHKLLELRGTIRVCCRVRPTINKESGLPQYSFEYRYADSIFRVASKDPKETVTGAKGEQQFYDFFFDRVFSVSSRQKDVFDEIEPLVQSALDGYSVCVFAYGQTGSGKTYTMEGDLENSEDVGMIQRSVEKIFGGMKTMVRQGWIYTVEASFIEIYNETIRDLLVTTSERSQLPKLEIKMVTSNITKTSSNGKSSSSSYDSLKCGQTDITVTNLKTVVVSCGEEVHELLNVANQNRAVAATKCNEMSSRSHSIFRLKLTGRNEFLNETSEAFINLVDLAGSERLSESGATGDRLKETQFINKSLSNLRLVISALSKKDSHVPFRDSKLTHLLSSSLGGNCKTLMFVNISPLEEHFNETLCSLRFAAKVNKCHIGVASQRKVVTQ